MSTPRWRGDDLGLTSNRGTEASIAERLVAVWSSRSFGPVFTSAGLRIDVEQPEGQWLLLVLAFLYAAKVRRAHAERTFLSLREMGILSLSRMARSRFEDRAAVLSVLRREYLGLVNKERKTESLFRNASMVLDEWGGRPIDHFRSLPQEEVGNQIGRLVMFGSTAYWYCRELRHLGVWPEAPVSLTVYVDSFLRISLSRLGMVGTASSRPEDIALEECQCAVSRWFNGDCLSLYRQGRYLCSQSNHRLCLEECAMRDNCRIWM